MSDRELQAIRKDVGAEERSGTAVVEDAANESVLSPATLGWDPHSYHLTIQFTGLGGGTGSVEAMGPGGTWTVLSAGPYAEDDILVIEQRFQQVKVVWAGAGTATATVWGHLP